MSSHFSRLWGAFLRTKTCSLENRYAIKVPLLGRRRRRRSPLLTLAYTPEMGRSRPYNMSVGYSCYSVLSGTSSNNNYSTSCSSSYTANSKTAKMTDSVSNEFQRLPTNVKPKHYQLSLSPYIEKFQFDGVVSIDVEVLETTNKIVLNALELNVESVQISNKPNGNARKGDILYNDEIVTFEFKEPISPGLYDLTIVFHGNINDKMRGLYRSKYVNEKGEDAYAVVTQFEATDARRCFPCWDEPALKATFSITLDVPKRLVALSNMPVKSQQDCGDLIKYHFETTPIMSTYLVAVVIGEYDYVEDRSSDGVLVRVYTPKGKKDQGLFALEVATKVLPYYKQYFNIAYPLPKIDLIAIADFSAGAMENWGLVTYRETTLLVDPQNTSALSKQWIALVVGHELAHQWFGNLVTMEWWTHLWLNEGYASFVEFLCVNFLFPEYDIWTQFINDSYIRALELDSLKNSHPIEVPVGNPAEIDEIFDDISYNKGASIIRMLHHYIGDDDFRKGMNIYLTRHQYKNTFTEDLWQALEEASNKPVGEVMSTWTKQMGFPQVAVSSRPSDKNDGIILSLSQSKYTTDGSDAEDNYSWLIPISISTSKNPGKEVVSLVLKEKSTEVFVPDVDPVNDWVKINPGTIDYFRTKYSGEMLEKLMPAIRDQSLPPVDRIGLLDDLFAMVKAGHTSTVDALKFISAFENETNYNVWSSISNILSKLTQLFYNTEVQESYEVYQKKILHKVYHRLGWKCQPNETHLDTLLRSLVLSRMALLNEPETINEAKSRFDRHISKEEILGADLRAACYKTVLRAGGEKEFNTLLDLYRTTDLHEEKDRIGRSLGAVRKLELISLVLNFAMSQEVRPQDKIFVIISVSLHAIGRDLAWQFFKDNWHKIKDQFSGALLTRLIKYLTENFNTEEALQDVVEFFQKNQVPGAERTIQQSVETIELSIKWLQRDLEDVKKFLN